jgi:hypothetical protein
MANPSIIAEQRIRRRVSQLTRGDFASARLLQPLFHFFRKSGIHAFLFGGTLRDFALNSRFRPPRDLDIVIDDGLDELATFIERQHSDSQSKGPLTTTIRRNRFGGLKVRLYGHTLDIWKMENTWAFKQNLVTPALFERLPNTTFLNLDAVVLELFPSGRRGRRLYEHGFFDGVQKGTIEVNLHPNPYPQLCVVRAITLAYSTGFKIGPKLGEYVSQTTRHLEPKSLESIQQHHYGGVRRSSRELLTAVDIISKNLASLSADAIDISSVQFDLDFEFSNWARAFSHELEGAFRGVEASRDSDAFSGGEVRKPRSFGGLNQIAERALWIWSDIVESLSAKVKK